MIFYTPAPVDAPYGGTNYYKSQSVPVIVQHSPNLTALRFIVQITSFEVPSDSPLVGVGIVAQAMEKSSKCGEQIRLWLV